MKKYVIAVLIVLVWASGVHAAPFVVCDSYGPDVVQPDVFAVKLDNASYADVPAVAVTGGVALKYDVGSVTTGQHAIRVKAVKNSAEWGRLESEEAVFTFVRPAAPATPAGIGLSAQ